MARGNPRARRWWFALAALLAALMVTSCSAPVDDASSISRTVSRIAGAGVVGVKRTPDIVCASMTAPDPSPTGDQRVIRSKRGGITVPSDPQRIVVLDSAALDATCAVGMWERVIGTATINSPDVYGFSRTQPRYLGTGVEEIPSISVGQTIDLDKVQALKPDLIIGVNSLPVRTRTVLSDIAPTVIVDDVLGWKAQYLTLASALGRETVGRGELTAFENQAKRLSTDLSTEQTQASVIRFSPTGGVDVVGPETFAGSVLIEAGVRRPPGQRETSYSGDPSDPDFAEGDCIYVMFADSSAQNHGAQIMRSDAWTDLGASRDRRVFAVDRQIWEGNGLIAARALLADLRESINSAVYD